MDICSEGHDEIVFDGMACPVCALIKDYEAEKDELQDEIKDLNNEIENLQKDD